MMGLRKPWIIFTGNSTAKLRVYDRGINVNYKELYQTIQNEHTKVFEKLDVNNLDRFMGVVKKHNRIFFIGVGREGLAARAFAMRLMHMGKEIYWIWDDTTPNIEKGDLLVAVLGDGQIGHIDYVCRKAKEAGAFLYVVTGSPSGKTASSLADDIFFVPASVYRGTDEVIPSSQPMGNLFEQCLFIIFDIIVMMIVDSTDDISFEKMSLRHRNVE